MKRIFALILSLIFLFNSLIISVCSSGKKVSVSAKSAVLICADDGTVLFEKNPHEKLPMASTTKMMTALLSLESEEPDRTVKVLKQDVTVEGTSMGLKAGDEISLYSLACGMLLSSGNDAANTAARAISGDIESFAELMNSRARLIGMNNTNFVTPSGLDAENHYSSAFDMALLGAECIKNSDFVSICSEKNLTVSVGNGNKRTLYNHNKLLGSCDGVFGIKTGFTRKSGRCLVSACRRNGITLIAVTLNDPDDWRDHKNLYDYGFSLCRCLDDDLTEIALPVTGGEKGYVCVECATVPYYIGKEEAVREIFIDHFAYAPVSAGQKVGRVNFFVGNKLVKSVDIVSLDSVKRKKH